MAKQVVSDYFLRFYCTDGGLRKIVNRPLVEDFWFFSETILHTHYTHISHLFITAKFHRWQMYYNVRTGPNFLESILGKCHFLLFHGFDIHYEYIIITFWQFLLIFFSLSPCISKVYYHLLKKQLQINPEMQNKVWPDHHILRKSHIFCFFSKWTHLYRYHPIN